jgi:RNA polymerase sigma-70 factor (ECF subfamily)
MTNHEWLAERFEENRDHLRAVAYRMLGSTAEAEDAVQETWLRLGRTETESIENLGGWLTTVVARVALDVLRSRKARREESLELEPTGAAIASTDSANPESQALLADSVGSALLVVLEMLTPAERLSFVLHDMFAVPFEEIAPIVERTPEATRQLASRARRRVRGADPDADVDPLRRQEIVAAFLKASREGNFLELVELLDPEVVFRSDHAAAEMGAPVELRGMEAVAGFFNGRAQAARVAFLDGIAGAVWAPGLRPKVAFQFTFDGSRITSIHLTGDAGDLEAMEIEIVKEKRRTKRPAPE